MNKRLKYSLFLGLILWISIVLNDAVWAGSSFSSGLTHALVFSTLGFSFIYGFILLGQFLAVRFIHWVTRQQSKDFTWYEFIPSIALICVLAYGTYSAQFYDPFPSLVLDKRPETVKDVNFWYMHGFGNSQYIISFHIAPKEFPLLLEAREYSFSPYQYFSYSGVQDKFPPLMGYAKRNDFNIPLPQTKLTEKYEYHVPGRGGGLNIYLYTNDAHDTVYFFRSYD